jgi:hypothetical protein
VTDRLILGLRPSRGASETILPSSTTRGLDRLMSTWRDHFETRNLYTSSDSDEPQLEWWLAERDWAVVVALGQEVAEECDMRDAPWLSIRPRFGTYIFKLPHPSGRNRWYNDPAHLTRAAVAFHSAARIQFQIPTPTRTLS